MFARPPSEGGDRPLRLPRLDPVVGGRGGNDGLDLGQGGVGGSSALLNERPIKWIVAHTRATKEIFGRKWSQVPQPTNTNRRLKWDLVIEEGREEVVDGEVRRGELAAHGEAACTSDN